MCKHMCIVIAESNSSSYVSCSCISMHCVMEHACASHTLKIIVNGISDMHSASCPYATEVLFIDGFALICKDAENGKRQSTTVAAQCFM